MMNEELPVHEEERNIMNAPNKDEEPSIVPQPITDS